MSKVNKSSETGKFVSDKKVDKNPKTTYEQTVKKPTGNKQTGKAHRQTPKK